MFRSRRCPASIAMIVALLGSAHASKAGEVVLDDQTFTLPDGFAIERVAGPPLVDRPIVADFDERGRLYVADSSGSSEPVQTQLAEKPHRIVRLEDTDNDGVFDHSTLYADRMMFPEGAMWHDGSLYVAAPPEIWKLTDTNDDGIADRREVWFDGQTLTGCANDLHGPYLGRDGWIYWCKGAFAEQSHQLPDGSTFVTRASHIFRRHPDGGPVEPVMTGGMDNPVDVAFSASGERFFTTTFLQYPAGGKRDGIIHAVHGGIYGKVHDPIFDPVHEWTDPEVMPVMTHLGPAAPAGLTSDDMRGFGPVRLFAACFNMRKVTQHDLQPEGATYRTIDSDFLVSDNRDFHPTDVLQDADGSLLVINTGGWYKLCCPTSQLQKEDVLGAIYRIRREGAPKVEDPRGLEIEWESAKIGELIDRISDRSRPAVRHRAIEALSRREGAAEELLYRSGAGTTRPLARLLRLNLVWAASRIDHPDARRVELSGLDDPDATVRQAALNAVSLRRNPDATPRLIELLADPSPHIRRGAAEALGRIGAASAVPALLRALSEPMDRTLSHALTYALIEINDPDSTAHGLSSDNLAVQRASLIALDQMRDGELPASTVAPLLASPDPDLRAAASWIAGRHPEWGSTLAGFFEERLQVAHGLDSPARAELVRQLARFATSEAIRDLVAAQLHAPSTTSAARGVLLDAMAASNAKQPPITWVDAVAAALSQGDVDLIRSAVAAARALAMPVESESAQRLADALRVVGADETQHNDLRLSALAAVPGGLSSPDDALFDFLLDRLNPDEPVAEQTTTAEVLSRSTLTSKQWIALAQALPTAGPLVVGRLLPAFSRSNDVAVGRALVESLQGAVVRLGLREETLRPILAGYGEAVEREAAGLYDEIAAGAVEQNTRVNELLANLSGGDVRRGQDVFNSTKAACVACHAIGYLGGEVGPDLTRIGGIRTERDLLEAIAYPNASFVQSYEPALVATIDGRVFNGLVRGDDGESLVLATGPNEEVRIPREEIEAMQPGTVSVMPSGLDQQLTRQELADLVAFLRACQ